MTGEEWVAAFCENNGLDWDQLTKAERFKITMLVPCTIRCFRVGGPVDVARGEQCPECGQVVPTRTAWEHLLEEPPPV